MLALISQQKWLLRLTQCSAFGICHYSCVSSTYRSDHMLVPQPHSALMFAVSNVPGERALFVSPDMLVPQPYGALMLAVSNVTTWRVFFP